MAADLNQGLTKRDDARVLARRYAHATWAILAAVAMILFGGLVWAARGSDQGSVERQVRVARHSIDIALDSLALQQELVALWDESAEEMVAAKPDQFWLRYNITEWLYRMFGHNVVILLDAEERPVQVVVNGKPVSHDFYDRISADLAPLVGTVHGRHPGRPGRHDRMPGDSVAPDTSVQTTKRAVHDTHMMLIDGRPATASAMLIKPATDGYIGKRSKWPVIVSIRYLDAAFMKQLEDQYLIASPRFSRTNDRSSGEVSQLLKTEWGDDLGYLIWTPERPGSGVLTQLLPINAVALILLALILFVLTYRLRGALDERGRLAARAERLAYHDTLTGLPNRRLLIDRLDEALANGGAARRSALLLIDIDRFKQVNDLLGHLAGDELIRQFAERLTSDDRPGRMVARLGGDEFAVLLTDLKSEAELARAANEILKLFIRPFRLQNQEVVGAASIGGSMAASGETLDSTELMRRADVALYRAKGDGRHCARIFHVQMDSAAQHRNRLANDMRRALADHEFSLSAQPLVDRDRKVVGHELLLRWDHPELGAVSPEEIIPIAEDSGLIVPIGGWVLRHALAASRRLDGQFVAMNLSPVQLRDESFAPTLLALCAREGADPRRIELEITEQTLLDDNEGIRASLEALREAGFRLALDDFGTGYSSLGYLRRFSVDKIKVDRSFVAAAGEPDTQAIIVAIVRLGRALGLTVAAEGVETEEQDAILRAAGVDQFQGHLYAQPSPLAEVPGRGTADEDPAKQQVA